MSFIFGGGEYGVDCSWWQLYWLPVFWGWNILNIGLIIAMIMFLLDIQGYLSDKVKRGFDFLGKMSMNMWLIHLFFINYGFHFRNPFADLAWIYLESLAAAYIIWCVYHKLCGCKWFNKIR